jgi:hypothetical protein
MFASMLSIPCWSDRKVPNTEGKAGACAERPIGARNRDAMLVLLGLD